MELDFGFERELRAALARMEPGEREAWIKNEITIMKSLFISAIIVAVFYVAAIHINIQIYNVVSSNILSNSSAINAVIANSVS